MSNFLNADMIRRFYHEESEHFLCGNPSCGKPETQENKHKVCSRCKGRRYCSRECQKAHWKEHKKICQLVSEGKEKMKTPVGLQERINLFKDNYKPLLQLLTLWSLNGGKNNWKGETHLTWIELVDLPQHFPSPRLEIQSFDMVTISSQEDFVQRFINDMKPHRHPLDTAFGHAMLVYHNPSSGNIDSASILPFSWDKVDFPMPTDSLPIKIQARFFDKEAKKYMQTINDMARGKRNDLVQASRPVSG